MSSYRTLAAPVHWEADKVKGSRFLALAAPVASGEAVRELLAEIAGRHPGARHHCFAYRLGSTGSESRASDAGEPAGSAGRPILQQIEGRELTDTLVVVTRYFGGIKLGVGGLVRAYGGAARGALERARIVIARKTTAVTLTYPYELSGAVQALLARHSLRPQSAAFREGVTLRVDVAEELVAQFLQEFTDRTAGRGRGTTQGPGTRL